MKKKILVILGPTSTGKSDLAVSVAKKLFKNKAEVISADSRQVYKGLDLGTGKITKKEMSGVPHHILDVVSPKKIFSVTEFKKLADKKIEDTKTAAKDYVEKKKNDIKNDIKGAGYALERGKNQGGT
jgi:tRNA dimethylallyltransferase